MSDKPVVKRQALTREQISKLSHEELVARLTDQERKDVIAWTRMSFDKTPPKRRSDEGEGEHRRRVRESEATDQEEFARSLRLNSEATLYSSKDQREKRAIDTMASIVTPETAKARREAEAARKRRDHLADLEAGRLSGQTPVGGAGWEGK